MDGHSIATNTLLMPNIPALFFEYPASLDFLRSTFEQHGSLHAFIAMKGFRRLMIIYDETLCAVNALESLDKKTLLWNPPSTTSNTIQLYIKDADEHVDIPGIDGMQIRLYYGQVSLDRLCARCCCCCYSWESNSTIQSMLILHYHNYKYQKTKRTFSFHHLVHHAKTGNKPRNRHPIQLC